MHNQNQGQSVFFHFQNKFCIRKFSLLMPVNIKYQSKLEFKSKNLEEILEISVLISLKSMTKTTLVKRPTHICGHCFALIHFQSKILKKLAIFKHNKS